MHPTVINELSTIVMPCYATVSPEYSLTMTYFFHTSTHRIVCAMVKSGTIYPYIGMVINPFIGMNYIYTCIYTCTPIVNNSHDGLDDHTTHNMFWPWHICEYTMMSHDIHVFIPLPPISFYAHGGSQKKNGTRNHPKLHPWFWGHAILGKPPLQKKNDTLFFPMASHRHLCFLQSLCCPRTKLNPRRLCGTNPFGPCMPCVRGMFWFLGGGRNSDDLGKHIHHKYIYIYIYMYNIHIYT